MRLPEVGTNRATGSSPYAGLTTKHARLFLDVYPNPAAIEGRTVVDYEDSTAPRRSPRATLELDDGAELFLWPDSDGLRVAGPALESDGAAG